MKQFYATLFSLFITILAYGQCNPNPPFTAPGIYPPLGSARVNDTIYLLPLASTNSAYSQTVDIVVPTDSTISFGGGSITADIDSMRLIDVLNTPNWLTHVCDNSLCAWLGGSNGCINFSGTAPASEDTVLMVGRIEAFANLGTFGQLADTFNVYIQVITSNSVSIEEEDLNEPRIGPNPVTSQLTIKFPPRASGSWKFELLDITGRTVHSSSGASNGSQGEVNINRDGWPEGLYLYRLHLNGDVHTGRLIVRDGL